ncbi:MAG: helix-turn-helix transcriptional regulator [Thermodesulfobium sp.]
MSSYFRDNIARSRSICEKINPIVKPISDHFGVHTFGYRKFFADGNSFGMSNNFSWTTFCLENFDKKIIPNYENEIKAALNEDKFHFFRIGKPNNKDAFLSALYELDIWNTCSLYKKMGDGIEAFYFASTRENSGIVEKYTNNIALFERFSYHFKNKLLDIISLEDIKSSASPTISPKVFESSQETSSIEDQNIKQFLSTTPIHKFFLNVNEQDITLSFQEFRCLALLSQGKTAKEIGNSLKISQRTVEEYIDNIKRKVKMNTRSQLIDLFLLNFHHDRNVLKYLAK